LLSSIPSLEVLLAVTSIAVFGANARADSSFFQPGNLVESRSVYDNNPANVQLGQVLPPNCTTPPGGCGNAIQDGTYPFVWNNDSVDGSFGITSKIFLDQITAAGSLVSTLEVPNSSQNGVPPTRDGHQLHFKVRVGSESFLGSSTPDVYAYLAPIDAVDVSNYNTPSALDPINPVPATVFRVVANVDRKDEFKFTATNAYSGNNGRAAILNNSDGANFIYTAGNAGNGANPQPDGIIIGAGAQFLEPENKALVAQNPEDPTPLASFNITQLGNSPDKIGKDDTSVNLLSSKMSFTTRRAVGVTGLTRFILLIRQGPSAPTRPVSAFLPFRKPAGIAAGLRSQHVADEGP
jgi:hypothetical protein